MKTKTLTVDGKPTEYPFAMCDICKAEVKKVIIYCDNFICTSCFKSYKKICKLNGRKVTLKKQN